MGLIIRFIRAYALPYWPYYLVGITAVYATNQLTVWIPGLVKETLDSLVVGDGAQGLSRVGLIALAALAIMVVRTTSRVLIFNPGRAAEFRFKNHLIQHLLSLPQSFHDAHRVGDLMSRATNDLRNVRALVGFAGLQIFEMIFLVPLTLMEMIALDGELTAITCGLLTVAMAVFWLSAQLVVTLTRENLECLSDLSDQILASYSAAPVIQGYCAQPAFSARFDRINGAYVLNGLKLSALRSFVIPVVNVMGSVAVGYVLWAGGNKVMSGALTIGALAAFSGYIAILVGKLFAFGWTITVIQRGMVSLARVYELLETPLALPPVRSAMPGPQMVAHAGQGYRLEIKRLTFTYPGAEDRGPALRDVNVTLEPGQTLGIFGHTGSGKTTLVQLLARIYTPPPGTVFLNGVDICDAPLSELRKLVALVPQDPFLFTLSLRDNIVWGGIPDEAREGVGVDEKKGRAAEVSEALEVDEERLRRAVHLAGLEPDLDALSEGLDTLVGARGITLSGGQRQRTALARAFYRSFQILLLDDVLAAVDHKTEARLIQNIYAVSSHGLGEGTRRLQTTLIISHRVSALLHADQILVLEEGDVVDRGPHDRLIRREGVYRDAWLAQKDSSDDGLSGGNSEGPLEGDSEGILRKSHQGNMRDIPAHPTSQTSGDQVSALEGDAARTEVSSSRGRDV